MTYLFSIVSTFLFWYFLLFLAGGAGFCCRFGGFVLSLSNKKEEGLRQKIVIIIIDSSKTTTQQTKKHLHHFSCLHCLLWRYQSPIGPLLCPCSRSTSIFCHVWMLSEPSQIAKQKKVRMAGSFKKTVTQISTWTPYCNQFTVTDQRQTVFPKTDWIFRSTMAANNNNVN